MNGWGGFCYALLGLALLSTATSAHAEITATGALYKEVPEPGDPYYGSDFVPVDSSFFVNGGDLDTNIYVGFYTDRLGNEGAEGFVTVEGGSLVQVKSLHVGAYQYYDIPYHGTVTVSGGDSRFESAGRTYLGGEKIRVENGGHFQTGEILWVDQSANGYLELDQGSIQSETLILNHRQLKGRGTIHTNGLIGQGHETLDFNGSNVASVRGGTNNEAVITVTASGGGGMGVTDLLVRNGAQIATKGIHFSDFEVMDSKVVVTGEGTTWDNEGFFEFSPARDSYRAEMLIQNEAIVRQEGTLSIGLYFHGEGRVAVRSGGKLQASDDIQINEYQAYILDYDNKYRYVDLPSTLTVSVGDKQIAENLYTDNGTQVQAGADGSGSIINKGTIILTADPTALGGTYRPLAVGADSGTFDNQGKILEFGGVWNSATMTFEVPSIMEANGGVTDLNFGYQRLGFRDGFSPTLDLVASFSQVWGELDFNAVKLGANELPDMLLGYEFISDLVGGPYHNFSGAMLSFNVGEGYQEGDFLFWYRPDGGEWEAYSPEDFTYIDGWVSFQVSSFSSYAVTIPEPSTGLLLLFAGGAAYLRRRK